MFFFTASKYFLIIFYKYLTSLYYFYTFYNLNVKFYFLIYKMFVLCLLLEDSVDIFNANYTFFFLNKDSFYVTILS